MHHGGSRDLINSASAFLAPLVKTYFLLQKTAIASLACLYLFAVPARAGDDGSKRIYAIPAGDLATGLQAFIRQSKVELIYRPDDIRGRRTKGVRGKFAAQRALDLLLRGTELELEHDSSGAMAVMRKPPQQAIAAPVASPRTLPETTTLDTVMVTAQKRVERMQDVPMAISVLAGSHLDALKIDGGSELLRATPNVTFSKTNFTTHNIQIRGVGTQVLPAGSDSGVAINYDGMPLVRNRFYEQEYFDVNRIEVLRGPQGTLHSRNATAGVVDMIPNRPGDTFEANVEAETGSVGLERYSAMVNQPITDELSLRLAGIRTRRDGIDYNTVTRRWVNDRDMWGGRLSLAWQPSDRFSALLRWERFEEDDERARTGKQLCHTDPTKERVGKWVSRGVLEKRIWPLNQNCLPGSLYSEKAFGIPNRVSLPAMNIFNFGPVKSLGTLQFYEDGSGQFVGALKYPFESSDFTQSKDLREIATSYDPRFRTRNDVVQLNVDAALGETWTLSAQSGWSRDRYWSTQDYNRFPSITYFGSSDGLYSQSQTEWNGALVPAYPLIPGGVFTDPQLGPANGARSADLSRSYSRQWWQEIRLSSDTGGSRDYSVGANFLDFSIDEDYFVFNNLYTLYSMFGFGNTSGEIPLDGYHCGPQSAPYPDVFSCVHVDPNPIDRLSGDGHNYFRSRGLARTRSAAIFGESYWKIADRWKLTIGTRYTLDKKTTVPVPSQLLLAPGINARGTVDRGYPEKPELAQRWGVWTGRIVLDWHPDIKFTDSSLAYVSLTRGYKAGGANSAGPGFDPRYLEVSEQELGYEPEFVVSFEAGLKSSLFDNRVELNAAVFHYDYRDYQVSKFVNRTFFTENFDASATGLELEAAWQVTPRLRVDGFAGWLRTRVANGEKSIDVMNRTQGNPDWMVLQPWNQSASNCIVPVAVIEKVGVWWEANSSLPLNNRALGGMCAGKPLTGRTLIGLPPESGVSYDRLTYPDVGQNRGEGFFADLGGNELPGAPRYTFGIGTQYTWGPRAGWELTARVDYFRQGASWARIYNAVNDRLRGWGNANLAVTASHRASATDVQVYVKNLLDETPITGAFINGDDSGLTTNVFTVDPRIVGVSIRKGFF